MPLVTVCGPVGAGKSTLVARLAEHLDANALPEGDETTNPYLARAYADPERWQARSQAWFAREALSQARLARRRGLWIWERPADERLALFTEPAYQAGHLTAQQFATVGGLAQVAMRVAPDAALRIAIRTDADTLDAQINGRDRAFERRIDRQWIEEHLARYAAYYARPHEGQTLWLDPAETDWRDAEALAPIAQIVSEHAQALAVN